LYYLLMYCGSLPRQQPELTSAIHCPVWPVFLP
jgi:hypothetical protein